ncbi:hypothetical protein F4859DRAFT_296897 [Xylaria cf. heliscus]|nr:hypothetical protein F4859DRAFT_296897 [Xylaria cf. heliscus]
MCSFPLKMAHRRGIVFAYCGVPQPKTCFFCSVVAFGALLYRPSELANGKIMQAAAARRVGSTFGKKRRPTYINPRACMGYLLGKSVQSAYGYGNTETLIMYPSPGSSRWANKAVSVLQNNQIGPFTFPHNPSTAPSPTDFHLEPLKSHYPGEDPAGKQSGDGITRMWRGTKGETAPSRSNNARPVEAPSHYSGPRT